MDALGEQGCEAMRPASLGTHMALSPKAMEDWMENVDAAGGEVVSLAGLLK